MRPRPNAPWSDAAVLRKVRDLTLPALEKRGPIEAWIVDDTGFPKKGKHSVGVARQYCGQLGKQDNCQNAVSISAANHHASLPIAYRLYLPKEWADDEARRKKAGVPEDVTFKTKPEIALDLVKQALDQPVTVKALALTLKESDWRLINWREGSGNPLKSRFARLRARPAHEDFRRNEPRPEEWLVIEWPETRTSRRNTGSPRSTPAYPLKRLPISSNFAGAL